MSPDLQALRDDVSARMEPVLSRLLPEVGPAPRLQQAMRYAALSGGKRVRPLLVYGAVQLFDQPLEKGDIPAAAVELIHAYSLVHDDLPAMDDDDLRRGQPTCHRAFDEATAILAGDTLQSRAFEVLATEGDYSADQRIAMIAVLSAAAGASGMAGGQMQDMLAHGQLQTVDALETMHFLKTGRLITASVTLGACAAGMTDHDTLSRLRAYGDAIGLAFQIQDDILDVTMADEEIGKPAGSDARHAKSTYPALIGLQQSQRRAHSLAEQAQELLTPFGDNAKPLQQLAHFIVRRNH